MLAAALEVGCTPRGRLPQDWDQSLRTAISEYDRIDPGCPKEVEDLRDSYGVAVHSWHDLVWRVLAATQPDAFDPSPRTVDPLDWRYGQGYSAGPERDAAVENAVRDRAKVYATACRLLSDPTMWTQVEGAAGPTDARRARAKSDENPEMKAIMLVVQYPDWSVAQIAKEVGVNKRTPYRWPRFLEARERARAKASGRIRRGRKARDGELEAWDEE